MNIGHAAKGLGIDDINLCMPPLYPNTAVYTDFMPALLTGGKCVVMSAFAPLEAIELVERERCTWAVAAPRIDNHAATANHTIRKDMASALHLAERPRESALLRLSGFSAGQVRAYLLLRTEMLAVAAFCIGVPLASAWMSTLYSQGPPYVFNVPLRLTVDLNRVAIFGALTALAALAGALVSTAGVLRASVAQGLRR